MIRSWRWLALVSLCAAPAVADEEGADAAKVRAAAQEFDEGRRAYVQRDYDSAAAHFENAFRDAPRVETLRLAIRAHKQAKNNVRAATLSEIALKSYSHDQGTVTLARQVIKEVKDKLVRVKILCQPACGLVVDERASFDEPAEESVFYLLPGQHQVTATWSTERARSSSLESKAGQEEVLEFQAPPEPLPPEPPKPPPEPPKPPPPAPKDSGLPPVVTFVGIGVTVALAGVTTWSGVDTKNNPGRDVVEAACFDKGEDCPEYQDGRDRQLRTNILLGTTVGVAVVTGVVATFFTDWDKKKPESAQRLVPTLGMGNGFQVGAEGRF